MKERLFQIEFSEVDEDGGNSMLYKGKMSVIAETIEEAIAEARRRLEPAMKIRIKKIKLM